MILNDERLKNVIINETARKEELSAYLFLKDFLFKNSKVVIGDSKVPNNILKNNKVEDFCDVYTSDRKIGLEVVTYENNLTYHLNACFYGNLAAERLNSQTISYKSSNQDKINHAFVSALLNVNNNYSEEQNKVILSREIRDRVYNKLVNLNSNKYNAFEQTNLALMSFGSEKNINIKNVANIVKNLKKEFKKTYDNVFVFMNKKVYQIDKSCKISVVNTWQNKNEFIH